MKAKILLSLMFVIGLTITAHAGNEGAQATPVPPPPTVLAEYARHGGFFVPPGEVASRLYQILSDGTERVLSFKQFSSEAEVLVVKKMSADELTHFKQLVDAVLPGNLIDPNPEVLGCMDAPSFSTRVYQATGPIVIAEWIQCKEMGRENAGPADQEIIQILNDLFVTAGQE